MINLLNKFVQNFISLFAGNEVITNLRMLTYLVKAGFFGLSLSQFIAMSGSSMDIELNEKEEKPAEIHESVSCNLNGAVSSGLLFYYLL